MPRQAPFDWSEFRLGIYIRSKPEELYDLWATPSGLTRWFLRSAAFAPSEGPPQRAERSKQALTPFEELTVRDDDERCRANDRYRWEWYFGGGVVGEQWILEARPPTKLIFGFGDCMKVEVLLRKHGQLCEVDLRQYHIPTSPKGRADLHMGCRTGWTFFLTNLKSVAEGSPDLRETAHSRTRQLHLVNM